jgi:hypothetical protein
MPENFTDDVEETLDPAEVGYHGCALPQIDDAPEGGAAEGGDDE